MRVRLLSHMCLGRAVAAIPLVVHAADIKFIQPSNALKSVGYHWLAWPAMECGQKSNLPCSKRLTTSLASPGGKCINPSTCSDSGMVTFSAVCLPKPAACRHSQPSPHLDPINWWNPVSDPASPPRQPSQCDGLATKCRQIQCILSNRFKQNY